MLWIFDSSMDAERVGEGDDEKIDKFVECYADIPTIDSIITLRQGDYTDPDKVAQVRRSIVFCTCAPRRVIFSTFLPCIEFSGCYFFATPFYDRQPSYLNLLTSFSVVRVVS
jgi:hypothetical protein